MEGKGHPKLTIDNQVDPGAVLELIIVVGAVEEQHPAFVPALILGTQSVDLQRGPSLDPYPTCIAVGEKTTILLIKSSYRLSASSFTVSPRLTTDRLAIGSSAFARQDTWE